MFWDLCSCCWHSTSHEKHFIWKHADVFAQPLLYKFILSSPSLSGGFSFSSWMGVTWFYHLSQLQLPLLGQLFPRLSAWCPAMLFCTLLHLCFLSVNGSPVFQTCSWNRCSPFFFFPPAHFSVQRAQLTTCCPLSQQGVTYTSFYLKSCHFSCSTP